MGQSYITSVFTTLRAVYAAFVMVWQAKPDVVGGWFITCSNPLAFRSISHPSDDPVSNRLTKDPAGRRAERAGRVVEVLWC